MAKLRVLVKSPLAGTFALSLLLLVAVGGWLLKDPNTTRSEALKTGGLAGGAIVALYALWLNDRRRRVEERRQEIERQRHDLEMRRTEQDRERISDERFAKSVELLGNAADQVRVGAMHALAGVARSRPEYTQTVLDVLCSYLRRPYTHDRYAETGRKAPSDDDAGSEAQELELQVRLTAQRLIIDLLPAADDAEAVGYDLDFTGAALEYLDLSGRKLGKILLRYVGLHSSTNLSGCQILGPAYFTAAGTAKGRLIGSFRCRDTTFHERAWFSGTIFGAKADFRGTTFGGEANFKYAVFAGDVDLKDATFSKSLNLHQTRFDGFTDLTFKKSPETLELYNTMVDPDQEVLLPPAWKLEPLRDGKSRIVVA